MVALYFALFDLYKVMEKYEEIVIYGTGMYSDLIMPKLVHLGLQNKIVAYAVSDKNPSPNCKNNIPIYCIDSLNINRQNAFFLIATSVQYEREIEERLIACGYSNYVFLSSYERKDEGAYFRFKNSNFEQYIEKIAEWYEYEHSERLINGLVETHQEICMEIKNLFCNNEEKDNLTEDNQIVFIVLDGQPRIYKFIGALINKGYKIVVIDFNHNASYPYCTYNESEALSVIYCCSVEQVLLEAVKFKPLLFYVRPAWLDSSIANIMLMQKDRYGKIVLDIHDIANGCYNLQGEKQWLYEIEKRALEQADGIVWRYDAEQFLQNRYGFCFQGKSIQLWDCCYDEFKFEKAGSEDVLRLCCIDSNAECLMPVNYDELCREGIISYANIYDIMKKIGNRKDCAFKLFVSKISGDGLEQLKRLKKEYTNFEYYVGYSPEQLIQCVSECDYGCELFISGRIPSDEECFEKKYVRLGGTYEIAATNRHFDFLNAGIPVISVGYKRQDDYLKKYGVLIEMDLNQLDIDYLKQNRHIYRENVKRAHSKLAVSGQIDRLIEFFNNL